MAIFDRLKNFADNVTDGLTQKAGADKNPDEVPKEDEAPSGFMKSAMSRAADTVLSASKKTLDLILSRYRPTLQLDAIFDSERIELIYEQAPDTGLDAELLVRLGTNSLKTLYLAQEREARLKEDSLRNLDLLKAAIEAAEEGDKPSKEKEHEAANEAHEARFSENAPLPMLLLALEALSQEQHEEAQTLCEKLLELDPEFGHPVLSPFMVERTEGEARLLWCERALWFHPLDAKLLQTAASLLEDNESITQLMAMAEKTGGTRGDVEDVKG